VYDSVGLTTYMKSLSSLAPRGLFALFGQSSGLVPPIDPGMLAQKGSLFMTRPTLVHHIASNDELRSRAKDSVRVGGRGQAEAAHRARIPAERRR
jgi:NADPH2:quinone reductase